MLVKPRVMVGVRVQGKLRPNSSKLPIPETPHGMLNEC